MNYKHFERLWPLCLNEDFSKVTNWKREM